MEQSKGIKIVFLMCLGIFLCMIDTTIMNIALPAIQSSVNTSLEKMSWVLNVYTMTIAVLAIPLGRIADIFGKAKMYILGEAAHEKRVKAAFTIQCENHIKTPKYQLSG